MLSQKYREWKKLDLLPDLANKKNKHAYSEGCLKFYISEGRI